ncbi:MAG: sigma-70 family RNA polymerase sigma factor [Acidobacteriaceae bacterium]|nr:sigma-70 family RNA polymerase sigma factor [Acidobacteriaceae bacterium]
MTATTAPDSTGTNPENTEVQATNSTQRTTLTPAEWATLVDQIKAGEDAGMEKLYKLFSRGIRYYLCRQLGPQELEDKVHDTFLIVVNAVKRGDLREPERLMGFVRTVVRRQVAAYIENAVHTRREQTALENGITIADRKENPEQEAIVREKAELMKTALAALSKRDRDILVRFYLKEQPQEQICREMSLTETQFRLMKSRAKAKFGEIGRKKLASSGIFSVLMRAQVS